MCHRFSPNKVVEATAPANPHESVQPPPASARRPRDQGATDSLRAPETHRELKCELGIFCRLTLEMNAHSNLQGGSSGSATAGTYAFTFLKVFSWFGK